MPLCAAFIDSTGLLDAVSLREGGLAMPNEESLVRKRCSLIVVLLLSACAPRTAPPVVSAPAAEQLFANVMDELARFEQPSNEARFDALTGILKSRGIPFEIEPFTVEPRKSEPRTQGPQCRRHGGGRGSGSRNRRTLRCVAAAGRNPQQGCRRQRSFSGHSSAAGREPS